MASYDGGPIKLVSNTDRQGNPQQQGYINGTSSQLVKSGPGTYFGVSVNSHSSGTIKLWDNTAGSGAILLNTFTFPTGSGLFMIPDGVDFNVGLFVTVGGTIDYTIIYS